MSKKTTQIIAEIKITVSAKSALAISYLEENVGLDGARLDKVETEDMIILGHIEQFLKHVMVLLGLAVFGGILAAFGVTRLSSHHPLGIS